MIKCKKVININIYVYLLISMWKLVHHALFEGWYINIAWTSAFKAVMDHRLNKNFWPPCFFRTFNAPAAWRRKWFEELYVIALSLIRLPNMYTNMREYGTISYYVCLNICTHIWSFMQIKFYLFMNFNISMFVTVEYAFIKCLQKIIKLFQIMSFKLKILLNTDFLWEAKLL